MSKLGIVATMEVAPGARDKVLAALNAHKARCLKDEAGTLAFDIFAPRDAETRIHLCEVYEDDAAFELHRKSPSRALFQKETAGSVVALDFTRCDLVA